jgi:hypothetical protein
VPAAILRRDLEAFQTNLSRQRLLPGSRPARGWARLLSPAAGALRLMGRLRLPRRGTVKDDALRPAVASLLRQAWLDLRTLGWAPTLSAWAVRRNRICPRPAAEAIALVDRLVIEEAAGQWFCACACKERALVAAFVLERFFGIRSRIVVGMITVPFQMHAWATAEGQPLTDDPNRIAQFDPLIEYDLGK